MFFNTPFDIQVEIIKRIVPVKSLIRFRSVSKQWRSLIESSEFITHHSLKQTQLSHLLVKYNVDNVDKYVSIVDDDSFPQHKFSSFASETVGLPSDAIMVHSSHGLVVFLDENVKKRMNQIIIWNPSIRKAVSIPITSVICAIGFGVCSKTINPKIVKITRASTSFMKYDVEIFELNTRIWRSVSMNLPHKPCGFLFDQVVVTDGVIYWLANDWTTESVGYHRRHHRIISFDLTTEEFGEVELPIFDSTVRCISKIKECLTVLIYIAGKSDWDVWMMSKNGASNSLFTKLFRVNIAYDIYNIIGLRENGQPVLVQFGGKELEVYDPCSTRITSLGIHGSLFRITSYTESLLLLNHFNYVVE